MVDRELRLKGNFKDVNEKLKKLERDFSETGETIDQVFGTKLSGSIDTLTSKVGGVSQLGSALGPVGVAAGGAAAAFTAAAAAAGSLVMVGARLAASSAEQTNQVAQLARNLGINVQQFSALTNVAARFGAEADDVQDLLKELEVKARDGVQAFRDLGIEARDASGRFKDGSELLAEFQTALAGVATQGERNAIIDEVASDAGIRAAGILRLRADELRTLTDAEIASGRAISQSSEFLAAEYREAAVTAQQALGSLTRTLGDELLPVFTPLLAAFAEFVRVNREDIGDAAVAFGGAVEGIIDVSLSGTQAVTAFAQATLLPVRFLSAPGWLGAFEGANDTLEEFGTRVAEMRTRIEDAREDLTRTAAQQVPFPDSPRVPQAPEFRFGVLSEEQVKENNRVREAEERKQAAAQKRAKDLRDRFLASIEAAELSHKDALTQIEALGAERIAEARELGFGPEVLARLRDLQQQEVDDLKAANARKEAAETEAADRKAAADLAAMKRESDARAKAAERLLEQVRTIGMSEVDIVRSIEDEKLEALRAAREQGLIEETEFLERRKQAQREASLEILQIRADEVTQYAAAGLQLADTIAGFADAQADNAIIAAERRADREIAALEASGAAEEQVARKRAAIEAQLQAQKEQLAREEFERNKGLRLVEAVINTAGAVINGLNTQPFFPVGIAMGALAAATGAIQIATIASQQFSGAGGAAGSVRAPAPAAIPASSSGGFSGSRPTGGDSGTTRQEITVNFQTLTPTRRTARDLQDALAGVG